MKLIVGTTIVFVGVAIVAVVQHLTTPRDAVTAGLAYLLLIVISPTRRP